MTQFIDRRLNSGKKSTVNRQRFINRYKTHIKSAVHKAGNKRNITNIAEGEQITIPIKDLSEPEFESGKGGYVEQVLPGNDRYISGDTIKRPPPTGTQNKPGEASQSSENREDFIFELSREEFLDLYFEDLELPHLVKKELSTMSSMKLMRHGLTTSGTSTNINIMRSMRQATGRRIALSAPYKRQLLRLEESLRELEKKPSPNANILAALLKSIADLKKKIAAVPFIDSIDLRYNHHTKIAMPSTQAVMFCIMDVSGSMDEHKKEIAKRFFILLYLFLTKNYQKIELIFIRHHTSAKEVNEEDFFYSRETGGTVVSSALELLGTLIDERFNPNLWNIYVAQASDGDNWNADSPYCLELLKEKIMRQVQYFTYIEIMPRQHQSLWEAYLQIQQSFTHFAMQNIGNLSDIYPVFRDLFKRKIG